MSQDMREIADFLKKCRVFYVATDDGGQPRVRPFGAHLYKDGRLYFITNGHKNIYRQLVENPRVEICSYVDREWIRLTGTVEFLEDDGLKREFLAASPERAQMFYKMPKLAQKALLKKLPGLKNMVSADQDYMEGAKPFILKDGCAAVYSLKDETKYYSF